MQRRMEVDGWSESKTWTITWIMEEQHSESPNENVSRQLDRVLHGVHSCFRETNSILSQDPNLTIEDLLKGHEIMHPLISLA